METQEAPKRKYKKHKQGFKIAVNHKLYVKEAEREYEPLYVQVRAKNQSTLIRSRFQCCIVASDFRLLQENKIIAECLEVEKEQISTSIRKEVELSGDSFSIKEWYRKFSQSDDRKYLSDVYIEYVKNFYLKVAHEKNVDKALILHGLDETNDDWAVVTTMRFLYAFGVEIFKRPLDLIEDIVEYQSARVNFLIHQQPFKGIGYFSITASMVRSDWENGLFTKTINYLYENQQDGQSAAKLFLRIQKIFQKNRE